MRGRARSAVAGDAISPASTRFWFATVALALLWFSTASCDWLPFSSKTCTTSGCLDQFSATVIGASADLPAGMHTVSVTTDTGTLSCTFNVPFETLPGGGMVAPVCQPGLLLSVGPNTSCTETVTATASVLRCEPIMGQFREDIVVMGTPTSIVVRQSVGGTPILDRSIPPAYQESRPNGPECDPVCRQARVEWTL